MSRRDTAKEVLKTRSKNPLVLFHSILFTAVCASLAAVFQMQRAEARETFWLRLCGGERKSERAFQKHFTTAMYKKISPKSSPEIKEGRFLTRKFEMDSFEPRKEKKSPVCAKPLLISATIISLPCAKMQPQSAVPLHCMRTYERQ